MKLLAFNLLLLFRLGAAGSTSSQTLDRVCKTIAQSLSTTDSVFYPGDPEYDSGIAHWATSSTQLSKCVVEPTNPTDVGKILVILGKTRTPFAIKSGGHATNKGFSSTTGVHISLTRFKGITYNATSATVDVGPGLVWDDVYAALEPFGVSALGARVTGIGIGGFLLGGGYSWQSNEHGLAIDNIIAFELVKPDGRVAIVTKASDPKLFFGLKGGMNNFGIVTKFTLKTFPQGQVWGGFVANLEASVPDLEAAIVNFQATVTDPKASIVMAWNYLPSLQQIAVSQLLFYNGPTPPPGMFDAFLRPPVFESDISTRSFLSLIQASPTDASGGVRTFFNGFPVLNLTANLSHVLVNETKFWGPVLASKSAITISYSMEMFQPSIYSHNPDPTAYPPSRKLFSQPFEMAYAWNSSDFDADMHAAAIASAAHIQQAAIAEGQIQVVNAPIYPNYGLAGTPIEKIYGRNVPALRALKNRVDPHDVMGLAGGWKF
ncbi:putative FAD-linked oxidoreductase [Psilocybe cubensis]|uniref:FAD-binding PCMH-type domain-containing protein n=2 Tax=Psilocybe cubensis TaxID=181762 RepID=A0A8H7Y6Q7_PSICU|nr:putative FAD-linked oxidoreductase [Psilocybe cubensis]KAH9484542.1 putative FAD-linked oxidoreductase [Psilocybe cubensis]